MVDHFRWKEPYERWAKSWIRKNFWRVSNYLGSEEDALQECIIVFFRVVAKYKDSITDDAHLMALYKTSVFNQWIVWSKKNNTIPLSAGLDVVPKKNRTPEIAHNLGDLILAISESSWELQYVIFAIADAPTEFLQMMFSRASTQKMNSRIKRMCRIRSRRNIVKELKKLCLAD